jgi:hypothetical protein
MNNKAYCIHGEPVLFPAHCTDENTRQGYWGEFYIYRYFQMLGLEKGIKSVKFNTNEYGAEDLIVKFTNGNEINVQVKTISRIIKDNEFRISIGVTGQAYEAIQYCDVLILVVREPQSKLVDGDKEWGGQVLVVKNHRKYPLINNTVKIPSIPENFIKLTQMWPEHLAQVNTFKSFKRY